MTKRILILLLLLLSACTTVGPAGSSPGPTDGTVEVERGSDPGSDFESVGSTREETSTSPTPGPTPTLQPATYYNFEPGINPLTGLPVENPDNLGRRPVMVKVSNWPREGRPHAGLTQADIVFEYFIGHQMNRFLAVYYGDDAEKIGPVRSGRLVDAQLVTLYRGILGYGNADPQVDAVLVEALGERALAFNGVPCPAMCGESTYDATGVFANSAALTDYAEGIGVDNRTPDLRGMFFQAETVEGDEAGESLRLEYANFSIMEWQYQREDGKYHLWMEEDVDGILEMVPMTDRNNTLPVAFDNIVVMLAEYIEYAPSLHDIVITEAVGLQPAMLFRDGGLIYGTWRAPVPDRPIIFELPDGAPLPLKPGKTWVVIVGLASQIQQPVGGEWKIYFGLP